MCNYNPNSVYVFRYVFISERNESENERITLKLSTNCLSWLIYGYRFGVECIEKGYFTSTFISARFLIILSKKKFLNISIFPVPFDTQLHIHTYFSFGYTFVITVYRKHRRQLMYYSCWTGNLHRLLKKRKTVCKISGPRIIIIIIIHIRIRRCSIVHKNRSA